MVHPLCLMPQLILETIIMVICLRDVLCLLNSLRKKIFVGRKKRFLSQKISYIFFRVKQIFSTQ